MLHKSLRSGHSDLIPTRRSLRFSEKFIVQGTDEFYCIDFELTTNFVLRLKESLGSCTVLGDTVSPEKFTITEKHLIREEWSRLNSM